MKHKSGTENLKFRLANVDISKSGNCIKSIKFITNDTLSEHDSKVNNLIILLAFS